jgi:hypothetical protein
MSGHDSAALIFDELEYEPLLLKTTGDPVGTIKIRTAAHDCNGLSSAQSHSFRRFRCAGCAAGFRAQA